MEPPRIGQFWEYPPGLKTALNFDQQYVNYVQYVKYN